jgi:hypothetical protein
MIDPEEIYNRLCKIGKEWCEKDHAAILLTETKKSVMSELMVECFKSGENGAKAEAYAQANPIYKDHIKAMCDARRVANLARVNYDAARSWAEAERSAESSRRAGIPT